MQTQTTTDACKSGSSAEASSSPIMNLFSAPKDNMLTLDRMHFETSRLLKDKDNNITYAHPLNTHKKLNYECVPEGNSRPAKVKNTNVIINF